MYIYSNEMFMYKYINAPYTYIVFPITEPAKSNHLQRATTFGISPRWLLFAGSTVFFFYFLKYITNCDVLNELKYVIFKDQFILYRAIDTSI